MSHHAAPIAGDDRRDIGALTIANETNELRISRGGRQGRGIHVKAHRKGASGVHVRIAGEDLFALREFLAELPEEEFVRPADPVEVPRWTEGDMIQGAHVPADGAALYRFDGEHFTEVPSPRHNHRQRRLSVAFVEDALSHGTFVVRYEQRIRA